MATKQVKVHADGCSPDTLELILHEDRVVFIKGDPKAPRTIQVDHHALFGTSTCTVGATQAEATAYTPKTPGNYIIGIAPTSHASKSRTVQVLCLPPATALGVNGSGTIKVNG